MKRVLSCPSLLGNWQGVGIGNDAPTPVSFVAGDSRVVAGVPFPCVCQTGNSLASAGVSNVNLSPLGLRLGLGAGDSVSPVSLVQITSHLDLKLLSCVNGLCYLKWFWDLHGLGFDVSLSRVSCLGFYPLLRHVVAELVRVCEADVVLCGISYSSSSLFHLNSSTTITFSELVLLSLTSSMRVGGDDASSSLDYLTRLAKQAGLPVGDVVRRSAAVLLQRNADMVGPMIFGRMNDAERRTVSISENLSTVELATLQSAFPQYSISSAGRRDHGHNFAAAVRTVLMEYVLDEVGYVKNESFSRGCRIVDIGGNFVSHLMRGRMDIHCCAPIIDVRDSARDASRMDLLRRAVMSKKLSSDVYDRCEKGDGVRCFSRSEACFVPAEVGVMMHSSYDVSKAALGEMIDSHGFSFVYVVLNFSTKIMFSDVGMLDNLRVNFSKYEVGGVKRIRFDFYNDASLNYDHVLDDYLWLLMCNVFLTPEGRCVLIEKMFCKLDSLVLKLTVCKRTPLSFDTRLSSSLFDVEEDNVVVTSWKYVPSFVAKCDRYERVYLNVPRRLYDLVMYHCLRSTDKSFNLQEIFSAGVSFNTRMTINGVDVYTPRSVPPVELLHMVAACYVIAYRERFNVGRVVGSAIDGEKAKRNHDRKFLYDVIDVFDYFISGRIGEKDVVRDSPPANVVVGRIMDVFDGLRKFVSAKNDGRRKCFEFDVNAGVRLWRVDEVLSLRGVFFSGYSSMSSFDVRKVDHFYDTDKDVVEIVARDYVHDFVNGMLEYDTARDVLKPISRPVNREKVLFDARSEVRDVDIESTISGLSDSASVVAERVARAAVSPKPPAEKVCMRVPVKDSDVISVSVVDENIELDLRDGRKVEVSNGEYITVNGSVRRRKFVRQALGSIDSSIRMSSEKVAESVESVKRMKEEIYSCPLTRLQVVPVSGDGFCLYAAFAGAVDFKEGGRVLRDRLREFTTKEEFPELYAPESRAYECWGTDRVLRLLSEMFQVQVCLHMYVPRASWIASHAYTAHGVPDSAPMVHLRFNKNHFDYFIALSGGGDFPCSHDIQGTLPLLPDSTALPSSSFFSSSSLRPLSKPLSPVKERVEDSFSLSSGSTDSVSVFAHSPKTVFKISSTSATVSSSASSLPSTAVSYSSSAITQSSFDSVLPSGGSSFPSTTLSQFSSCGLISQPPSESIPMSVLSRPRGGSVTPVGVSSSVSSAVSCPVGGAVGTSSLNLSSLSIPSVETFGSALSEIERDLAAMRFDDNESTPLLDESGSVLSVLEREVAELKHAAEGLIRSRSIDRVVSCCKVAMASGRVKSMQFCVVLCNALTRIFFKCRMFDDGFDQSRLEAMLDSITSVDYPRIVGERVLSGEGKPGASIKVEKIAERMRKSVTVLMKDVSVGDGVAVECARNRRFVVRTRGPAVGVCVDVSVLSSSISLQSFSVPSSSVSKGCSTVSSFVQRDALPFSSPPPEVAQSVGDLRTGTKQKSKFKNFRSKAVSAAASVVSLVSRASQPEMTALIPSPLKIPKYKTPHERAVAAKLAAFKTDSVKNLFNSSPPPSPDLQVPTSVRLALMATGTVLPPNTRKYRSRSLSPTSSEVFRANVAVMRDANAALAAVTPQSPVPVPVVGVVSGCELPCEGCPSCKATDIVDMGMHGVLSTVTRGRTGRAYVTPGDYLSIDLVLNKVREMNVAADEPVFVAFDDLFLECSCVVTVLNRRPSGGGFYASSGLVRVFGSVIKEKIFEKMSRISKSIYVAVVADVPVFFVLSGRPGVLSSLLYRLSVFDNDLVVSMDDCLNWSKMDAFSLIDLLTVDLHFRLSAKRLESQAYQSLVGMVEARRAKVCLFPQVDLARPAYISDVSSKTALVNSMIEFLYVVSQVDKFNAERYKVITDELFQMSGVVSVERLQHLGTRGVSVYDNHKKCFVVGSVNGEYGFAEGKYVRFDKEQLLYETDARYVLVTKYTSLMLNQKLADGIKDLDYTKFVMPVIEWVNGVPGCGKTRYVLDNCEAKDLVLTTTREGACEMRERMKGKFSGKVLKQKFRTISSYLMHGDLSEIGVVYIDEALMVHAGMIGYVIVKSKCKRLILLGDANQIPYIDRDHLFTQLYSHVSSFCKITSHRNLSYRCPVDVVYCLRDLYEGVSTMNAVVKSVKLCGRTGVNISDRPNTLFLVFNQADKLLVRQSGLGSASGCKIMTIHEAQGLTFPDVVVVRFELKPLPIFSSLPHAIVALSRHTNSFTYFSDVRDILWNLALPAISQEEATLRLWNKSQSVEIVGGFRRVAFVTLPDSEEFLARTRQVPFVKYPLLRIVEDITPPVDVSVNVSLLSRRVSSDLALLQCYYDLLMPGASEVANDYQRVIEADELHLVADHVKIDPVKNVGMKEKWYTYLKPLLRTGQPAVRRPTQRESLLGMIKRNLNVPQLDNDLDKCEVGKLLFENFVKSYICEDSEALCELYRENVIDLNSGAASEWYEDQPPFARGQLKCEGGLEGNRYDRFKYMTKTNVKPPLVPSANVYSSVQTIAYQTKDVNVLFCPIWREVRDRLLSVLKSKFMINVGMSTEEFECKMNASIDVNQLLNGIPYELDFSKYDKSQGHAMLDFECAVLRFFGVAEWLVKIWWHAHREGKFRDVINGVHTEVYFQRRSGDAATFIGNTLFLMAVIAAVVDVRLILFAVFGGDDSVFWLKQLLSGNFTRMFADSFNLECKLLKYKWSYFCSRFLLLSDDGVRIVPDPLKLVTKLGRGDLVNPKHVEDYRISCLDNYKSFGNSVLYPLVCEAMNERYKVDFGHDEVLRVLWALMNDSVAFRSMFKVVGPLLNDPSLPSLEM